MILILKDNSSKIIKSLNINVEAFYYSLGVYSSPYGTDNMSSIQRDSRNIYKNSITRQKTIKITIVFAPVEDLGRIRSSQL